MTEREGALPYGSRRDVSLREKASKPVDFTTYNNIFTRRAIRPWVRHASDTRHCRVVNTVNVKCNPNWLKRQSVIRLDESKKKQKRNVSIRKLTDLRVNADGQKEEERFHAETDRSQRKCR